MQASAALPLALVALVQPAAAQEQPAPTVEALTVTGERAEVETTIDRRSYSVAKDLAAQTGSVADVLRNIPAVQVDGQGNPSLLGQGNVTVLIDGRPSSQFSGPGLGAALQAMAAERIERVEVMTNPPAEYRADGSDGIINLVTRKARGAGASGSARLRAGSYGRAAASASLGYNAETLSLSGEAAYRWTPQAALDIQALRRIDPASGLTIDRRNVGRHRWTNQYGQARLGLDYDLGGRTRISGSVRYSANQYDTRYSDRLAESGSLILERTGIEDDYVGRGEAALTLRRTFGEGRAVTLHLDHKTYDGAYERLDLSAPAASAASVQRFVWDDSSPRTTFTAGYEAAGGGLKLGYDFEHAPKRTDQDAGGGPVGGPILFDPAQHGVFLDTETIHEAYVSYERGFGDLTLAGGVRFKALRLDLEQRTLGQRDVFDYTRLYPNLRLAYGLGEGRRLTASFSRRTNVPYSEQLNPLPLSQSPRLLEAGNPALRPEDAYSLDLAYEDRRGERLTIATLFYRETRDAFSILTTELPDAVMLQTTVNAGAIRRAGGEWAVSGRLTPRFSYNVSLDAYWIEIDAGGLGLGRPRSSVTGFGRASLTWQATPRDLLQLNLFTTGKVLRPQGHLQPTYSGALGYRHSLNNRVAWTVVVEDPFNTLENRSVERIGGVENHRLQRQASRSVALGLVWTFAGQPKEAGFDVGSEASSR